MGPHLISFAFHGSKLLSFSGLHSFRLPLYDDLWLDATQHMQQHNTHCDIEYKV